MLNFINKILKYFGYEVQECETIDTWILDINTKSKIIDDKLVEIYNLNKEKGKLLSAVEEKDKEIQALEHKVHNFQAIVEEDKLTIENLNKQTIELGDKIARLDSDILDLSSQLESYKQLANQRYKEVNLLRSRVKGLTDSRDNYKRKYKEVCGKIALKKACPKQ